MAKVAHAAQPLIDLLKIHNPGITDKELQSLILCGQVKVAGETVHESRRMIPAGLIPEILREKYVSRGGLKLEKALDAWSLSPAGLTILDAGASTGGFTDCLLQRGASAVHAVDVGYNQLDYRLRKDGRVLVHERTNIMTIKTFDPVPVWAVVDLSFRSLRKAAVYILSLCRDGFLIALIKPQFEWLSPTDDFDGVIRDTDIQRTVMIALYRDLLEEGVQIDSLINSPVTGTKGNREFLGRLSRSGTGPAVSFSFEERLERVLGDPSV